MKTFTVLPLVLLWSIIPCQAGDIAPADAPFSKTIKENIRTIDTVSVLSMKSPYALAAYKRSWLRYPSKEQWNQAVEQFFSVVRKHGKALNDDRRNDLINILLDGHNYVHGQNMYLDEFVYVVAAKAKDVKLVFVFGYHAVKVLTQDEEKSVLMDDEESHHEYQLNDRGINLLAKWTRSVGVKFTPDTTPAPK